MEFEQAFIELKGHILGAKSLGFYLGAFFFSFIAILLSLYMHSKKRDPSSTNTPPDFSWYFLLWDNTKRIVVGMLVMFVIFRFSPEMEMAWALGVGFFLSMGVDRAIQWLMTKNDFLRMNRDNLPTKPQA